VSVPGLPRSTAFPASSAIDRATYDPDRRILDLWYAGGDRYSYFNVPLDIYERLCAAPSAGEFVNRCIKPVFRGEIEPRRRRYRPR
jgi:hypothetical protein